MADYQLVVDGNLLEGLLVHEDAARLVLIQVLIGAALNDHVLQLLTDVEATLQHATVTYVLQLDDHDGVALTGFAVLEVNAHPNGAVHANGGAFLNVL